ncbi:MAG: ABC transporter permease [Lacunisphaera sp.]|nr:ABC transporter permease [Lacunisphaera sp.]
MQDLKFAFRQLSKSPGLVFAVVFSLALGIGANTTVLCWLETLVLKPLPGATEPSQMVALVSNTGGGNVSLPDLRDFGALDQVFAGTLATMSTPASLTVNRETRWLETQVVSANFFDLLGVRPLLGRTFRPDEDLAPGGNPLLVISESLWRRQFGADPELIGRHVELNRQPFTIIGVVPAAFHGTINPVRAEAWAPLSMIAEVRNQSRDFLTRRDNRGWHNLARLQPGVTLAQARAAVTLANARLATAYPDTNRESVHRVVPLDRIPWGAQTVLGPALNLLLVVSLGVQLIVTANIANLLLVRAAGRRKEIAVRIASGASRLRLIRQLLTESLVLAVAGGALGGLFAWWAVDALSLFLPPELATRAQLDFALSGWSLGLTVVLTLSTGVIFGLAPALQTTRPNLAEALKDDGRTSTGGVAHSRLRATLVVAEIALALLLLVGAGLCYQGLRQARQVDRGFDPDGVLLARMQIGMNGYNRETGKIFYREIRQRLATQPGVEEAALASWLPLGLSGCKGSGVRVEGYARPAGEDLTYEYAIISPRYFAALRIPLVAGRDFTDADDAAAPTVAIINEHFARRFWPGQDPLGRRFRAQGAWRTVVGVAQAGKYNRIDEAPWCFFYLPYQQGVPDLDLNLVVKLAAPLSGAITAAPAATTQGRVEAFAPSLRAAVHQQDPGVELLETLSLKSHASMALLSQLLAANLLVLLGAIALTLAAMGVYAVMAYTVSQRTREFGVRLALGATTGDLLGHVLGQGLRLAGLGIAIGFGFALLLARLLARFLYGVSPFDAATFLGVSLLLGLIAVAACAWPAWRAAHVDPMTALRAE